MILKRVSSGTYPVHIEHDEQVPRNDLSQVRWSDIPKRSIRYSHAYLMKITPFILSEHGEVPRYDINVKHGQEVPEYDISQFRYSDISKLKNAYHVKLTLFILSVKNYPSTRYITSSTFRYIEAFDMIFRYIEMFDTVFKRVNIWNLPRSYGARWTSTFDTIYRKFDIPIYRNFRYDIRNKS